MYVNNLKKPTSIIGQTGDCGKEDDVCDDNYYYYYKN